MALLDLNIELQNEVNGPVGNAAVLLAGSFMRIRTTEEFVIEKLDVFIKSLLGKHAVELDKADVSVFKKCLLGCDAIQLIKSTVLSELNKIKE